MQKGMELPINMIVVVAIAVLVLVVVAAFLTGRFFSGTSTIELQQAFSSACGTLKNAYNCDASRFGVIEGVQIPGDPNPPSFSKLCDAVYSSTPSADRPNQCLRVCGCPTSESFVTPSSPTASGGSSGGGGTTGGGGPPPLPTFT